MRATCSTRFAEPWVGAVATEVKLPRLGQGMESGTIVKWLKSEGDEVRKGEPLYELDTDKVTQEVEADASGVLLQIAVREGEVPVGRTIAVIGEEVEQLSSMRKTIARRLTEAWQAPVFQLGITVDMERALDVRRRLVEIHGDGAKPTVSDLLTKICAAALMRHRAVNALYRDDAIE